MQTLAQILAGVSGDPTQVNPGISPLLTQDMLNQQLAAQMLNPQGQGPQTPPQQVPSMGMGVPSANGTAMMPGFGSLGQTVLPALTTAYT